MVEQITMELVHGGAKKDYSIDSWNDELMKQDDEDTTTRWRVIGQGVLFKRYAVMASVWTGIS